MSKEKLIPDLRFPEFKNIGEWEINEFGELINILADYTANGSFASLKENVTYYSSKEYAVLVRTTDLDKKIFTPARFTDKRGYEFLSKTSLFGNEIVMANVGSIGKVFRVPNYDKPMTLAPNTYVLKFNDFVDEDFIYQLMLRAEFEKKLLSMVGSSTLMAINKSNLRSIKVSIPAKKEQQKIAFCLSSLDEVIAANSQKLDLLKDHKKALMQNLFPQEEETMPKVRFKEFENDGEWVEKIFDDILDITRLAGYEYSEYWKEDAKKEIIALRGYNIGKGTLLLHNLGYISNELSLQLSRSKLYKGDIVYPCVGTIGNAVVIEEDNKFHIQQNIAKLTPKKDVSPYFISQFLMSHLGLIEVNKFNATSSQPNVLVGSLRNFKIFIPKIAEQQKIASCLSSLDALIAAQVEKIEHLKLHKKGLMQGLFPKIQD